MITIGMDVGREHDPAALAVLHSRDFRPDSHRPIWKVLDVGNIELGTEYTQLAHTAADLAADFHHAGFPTVLAVDATGIGGAVVELARRRQPDVHLAAVTISGGHTLSRTDDHDYTVGKHRLTEVLQVALEQGGLRLPDTNGTYELHQQLANFARVPTGTGHVRHEASTGHDDLVLALELALWAGDALHDEYAGVTP